MADVLEVATSRPAILFSRAFRRGSRRATPEHNGANWISQFIRFAVAEAAGKHAGSDCVLTKLSELLFIDVVRRYLEALPPEHAGWLTGLVISFGKVISILAVSTKSLPLFLDLP